MTAKELVQIRVAQILGDFEPYLKAKGYWFRRLRDRFWQIFVITASVKHGRMEIDLACGIFPDWAGAYGSHIATAGKSLNNLRSGGRSYRLEDSGYSFSPSLEGLAQGLEIALRDFGRLALPYYEERQAYRERHPLLSFGHEWLGRHAHELPATAFDDLQRETIATKGHGITYPHYVALRDGLLAEGRRNNLPKAERIDSPILARHLLEYWSHYRGTGWDRLGA